MYITKIVTTPIFVGEKLVFATEEELSNALSTLGRMRNEPDHVVAGLIERMLNDLRIGMARSGLLTGLMRGHDVPPGPIKGTGTITSDGWSIGSRFSEHNTYGLPQAAPFMGLSIRILREEDDDGDSSYLLEIHDQQNPASLEVDRVGLNHTESLLASELGFPRVCSSLQVNVCYQPDGPELVFTFGPVLTALESIKGLESSQRDPGPLVDDYIRRCRDELWHDESLPLMLRHTPSGCRIRLNGCYGVQSRANTVGRQFLLRRVDEALVGPPDSIYRDVGPHVGFSILPPESSSEDGDVEALNRAMQDLASQLEVALWTYNFG